VVKHASSPLGVKNHATRKSNIFVHPIRGVKAGLFSMMMFPIHPCKPWDRCVWQESFIALETRCVPLLNCRVPASTRIELLRGGASSMSFPTAGARTGSQFGNRRKNELAEKDLTAQFFANLGVSCHCATGNSVLARDQLHQELFGYPFASR